MSSSYDRLFPDIGIPDWFDDETLYSLCSRYHRLTGNPSAEATAQQLFGGKNIGYQHDLPSGIDYFVQVTEGTRGDSHEIIHKHTLLPIYLPFRDEHDASDAYASMRSNSIGSLKYRLGILTSRFRANHILKACSKCMLEDYDNYGVAYWHLSHQYPGIWVCLKHQAPLSTCRVKSTGVGRFMWYLPETDILDDSDGQISDEAILNKAISLAQTSLAISNLPAGFHFSSQQLLYAYLSELKKLGFLTDHRCLKLNEIAHSYLKFINPLLPIHELSSLPKTVDDTKSHIGRLLRTPRSGTHPLRHILLINWLFHNWDNFFKQFSNITSSNEKSKSISTAAHENNTRQNSKSNEQVVKLINNDGYSPTQAARIVGIDTTTAVVWASQAGIKITRRPKTVSAQIRKNIIRSLKLGQDKNKIARKYRLSTATISRILRSEAGLQQTWLDARFNRRLKLERNRWLKLKKSNGNTGVKIMRNIAPITYAWLYRNDRIWLKQINSSIPKVQLSNNAGVDWAQRDNDFSKMIPKIVLDFSIHNPKSKITLSYICVKLPDLKAKLERLDKLPLTYKALQIALGSRFNRNTSKPLL